MDYLFVNIKAKFDIYELFIAELSEIGFDSFEEKEDELLAYIPSQQLNEALLATTLNKIDSNVKYSIQKLENKNWNQEWEAQFDPLTIADKVHIRADFHPASKHQYEIVITPKMSFGTGHHETTSMMITQMLGQSWVDNTVLDVGSGTGILSFAASFFGASKCIGVDNEEWAYHNSIENAKANNLNNCSFVLGTIDDIAHQQYQKVLANINKNVIKLEIQKYISSLASGGIMFLSGFLISDEKEVSDLVISYGLKKQKSLNKNNWACLSFQKDE